jgi:hypothetical protein
MTTSPIAASLQQPIPYTVADLVASKLLAGKTPRVVRAQRFEPVGIQAGLRTMDIFGMPFDPAVDDLFVFLQVARQRKKQQAREIKARRASDEGTPEDRKHLAILEREQTGLKVAGNSTAYGITIECNVELQVKEKTHAVAYFALTHGKTRVPRVETHGAFTNPILATTIIGPARLLLATAQATARQEGLDYALCDTDSLALVRPPEMPCAEFERRVQRVTDGFRALNPYPPEEWNLDPDGQPRSILETEDQNFAPGTDERCPLLLDGISSKRYALCNVRDAHGRYLDAEALQRRQKKRKTADRRPELRKVSASSLGDYIFPDPRDPIDPRELELVRAGSNAHITTGQFEVWRAIVTHAIRGDTSGGWINDVPHFTEMPAMRQLTLATVETVKRFEVVNTGKPYPATIKPFNFVVQCPQLAPRFVRECLLRGELAWKRDGSAPTVGPFYAPFTTDPADLGEWHENEWGRRTFWATSGTVRHVIGDDAIGVKAGDVYTGPLMNLADALGDYAHHPESKFGNGGPGDHGRVRHRHLVFWGARYHGKESVGFDPEVGLWEDEDGLQVDYEPLSDDEDLPDSTGEEAPETSKAPVRTFYDELKAIPRAWLAEHWEKSEREIKRIRNRRVHLSTELREEGARLIRLYHREQQAKGEHKRHERVLCADAAKCYGCLNAPTGSPHLGEDNDTLRIDLRRVAAH